MVATETPNPAGRRERNAARTRTAITDAARRLFDAHGYDGTTVEQIAEEADVAPRTIFRYFPTKESILFAEFEDVRRGILERLDAAYATEPAGADTLATLLAVLEETTALIQDRLETLSWSFHIAKEHAVGPNDMALRAETMGAVAERSPRGWASTPSSIRARTRGPRSRRPCSASRSRRRRRTAATPPTCARTSAASSPRPPPPSRPAAHLGPRLKDIPGATRQL